MLDRSGRCVQRLEFQSRVESVADASTPMASVQIVTRIDVGEHPSVQPTATLAASLSETASIGWASASATGSHDRTPMSETDATHWRRCRHLFGAVGRSPYISSNIDSSPMCRQYRAASSASGFGANDNPHQSSIELRKHHRYTENNRSVSSSSVKRRTGSSRSYAMISFFFTSTTT